MLNYGKTIAQCSRMCFKIEKQVTNMSNKIARLRGFKNFEDMQNYYQANGIKDEFCIGIWGILGDVLTIYENCGQ